MKRKTITIFFYNNGILLLNNQEIIKIDMSSVENYKVINSQKFIKELSSIFKKNSINTRLLTDNVQILIDSSYTSQEITTLESIFKELSFNNIDFINWRGKEYHNNYIVLDISTTITKLYISNKTILIPIILKEYEKIIINYLSIILRKYNIVNIRLFGNNENIYKIREEIERKLNITTYVYSNPSKYPLSLFI